VTALYFFFLGNEQDALSFPILGMEIEAFCASGETGASLPDGALCAFAMIE